MSGGVTHTDETSGQGECRAATTLVSFKYWFGGTISFCIFSSYKKGPKVHMWGGAEMKQEFSLGYLKGWEGAGSSVQRIHISHALTHRGAVCILLLVHKVEFTF